MHTREEMSDHAHYAHAMSILSVCQVYRGWDETIRLVFYSTRVKSHEQDFRRKSKSEDRRYFPTDPMCCVSNFFVGYSFWRHNMRSNPLDLPGNSTSLSMCSSRVARASFDARCENVSHNYTNVRNKTIASSILSRGICVEPVVFASVNQPACPSKVHVLDGNRTCSNIKWSRCNDEAWFGLTCWMCWRPLPVTIRLIEQIIRMQGKRPMGSITAEVLQWEQWWKTSL